MSGSPGDDAFIYAFVLCMHVLYVCLICMPYVYAIVLHELLGPLPYIYAMYVCLICMPYMYALYVCHCITGALGTDAEGAVTEGREN